VCYLFRGPEKPAEDIEEEDVDMKDEGQTNVEKYLAGQEEEATDEKKSDEIMPYYATRESDMMILNNYEWDAVREIKEWAQEYCKNHNVIEGSMYVSYLKALEQIKLTEQKSKNGDDPTYLRKFDMVVKVEEIHDLGKNDDIMLSVVDQTNFLFKIKAKKHLLP